MGAQGLAPVTGLRARARARARAPKEVGEEEEDDTSESRPKTEKFTREWESVGMHREEALPPLHGIHPEPPPVPPLLLLYTPIFPTGQPRQVVPSGDRARGGGHHSVVQSPREAGVPEVVARRGWSPEGQEKGVQAMPLVLHRPEGQGVQELPPWRGDTLPRGQGVQEAEPLPGDTVPLGQALHTPAPPTAYAPAPHALHWGLPSRVAWVPAGQGVHTVPPGPDWKVLGGQGVQVGRPGVGAVAPGGHSVQPAAPPSL